MKLELSILYFLKLVLTHCVAKRMRIGAKAGVHRQHSNIE